MATKAKTRTGGKSPTSSSGGRKHVRGKESKVSLDDEKETLAYKVLSSDDTKRLMEVEDVDELQTALAEVLQITNHGLDLKDGALVDYHVSGFWWAKEQGYTSDQLSAFYTVIHTLLDNLKEKQMSVTENLKEFRKLLVGIGQSGGGGEEGPKGGLQSLFDVSQAKLITDYIYTSLFQHYKLFEFTLAHTQAEEIIGTDLEIEVPPLASIPWPPPLDEAISEQMYLEHLAPASPHQESDESGAADGSGEGPPTEGEDPSTDELIGREKDLLAQLTAEEVQAVMDSVFEEMLGGLQGEVAAKLREKENAFINRINKIHKVAQ